MIHSCYRTLFGGRMNDQALALIDRVVVEARDGAVQDKRTILQLLALSPDSDEAAYLAEQARQFALEASGGVARIAGAIGIDRAPCSMNCKFCSFGEKWGLVTEESVLTTDQVLDIARAYAREGVTMITLRTTEFFDLNAVMNLARAIRADVPGSYELNMNVGELTPELCEACHEAGLDSAYHVLRLREGTDTPFNPEDRKRTIQAITESSLKWNTNIEPVGPEHTDEELADSMLFALSHHPYSVGIMPRVPVKGTPFGHTQPLAPSRVRQLVATLRLVAGSGVPFVLAHPNDEDGLTCGANNFSVERGAIPRDNKPVDGEWRGKTPAHALEALRAAGYRTAQRDATML